jgi:hypothetical protein
MDVGAEIDAGAQRWISSCLLDRVFWAGSVPAYLQQTGFNFPLLDTDCSKHYHHSKSPKRPPNVHQQSLGVGSPTRSREQVAKTIRGERSRQVASDYTYCVM